MNDRDAVWKQMEGTKFGRMLEETEAEEEREKCLKR